MKNAAVILSGCGVQDGSEIHEATLALYALASQGFSYSIFALDKEQKDVVNHLTSQVETQTRNILVESARIARGSISSLVDLNIDDFDTLIIPGGYGVAKNISTIAFDGVGFTVEPLVESIIKEFHSKKKPIGAICIAPAIIANVLGVYSVKVTLGAVNEFTKELSELTGSIIVECEKGFSIVDQKNLIVTTPAYMHGDSSIVQVGDGILNMVKDITNLITK